MTVSDEEMLVLNAIRQSFETNGGPGSSINPATNPFFINLTGQFDLLKAAKLVIERVNAHRAQKEKIARQEADRHLANARAAIATAEKETDAAGGSGEAGNPNQNQA